LNTKKLKVYEPCTPAYGVVVATVSDRLSIATVKYEASWLAVVSSDALFSSVRSYKGITTITTMRTVSSGFETGRNTLELRVSGIRTLMPVPPF
jgi:hypothetical protein